MHAMQICLTPGTDKRYQYSFVLDPKINLTDLQIHTLGEADVSLSNPSSLSPFDMEPHRVYNLF